MASKKSSAKKSKSGTKKSIDKRTHTRGHSRTHTKSPSRSHKSAGRAGTTKYEKYVVRNSKSGTSRSRIRVVESSSLGPGLGDPLLYVFLVIFGLSALALLIVGIWLLAARDGWPHGLLHSNSVGFTRFISFGTACIVAAILLLFVIVFIVLAAISRSGAGARINRLIAIALAGILFLVFLLMIISGIMFASHSPTSISNLVRDSWVRSVNNDESVAGLCHMQENFGCQGWYDNQCRDCRPTVDGVYDYSAQPGSSCDPLQRQFCPRCFEPVGFVQRRNVVSALDMNYKNESIKNLNVSFVVPKVVRTEVQGCRTFVRRRNRTFFIPFTIYLIFLSIILIFLTWKTCLDSSGRR